MIKVLFIAYHFPPIGGAGVQRSLKFARYLPEEGYLPVVITGSGLTNNRWAPKDSTLQDEIPEDIPIYRVETYVPQSRDRIWHKSRAWLGLKQPFSKWWTNSAIDLGKKALSEEGAKLIYASMSPFESAEVAGHLSKEFGIPWMADLRDPWALDEMQIYPSSIHRKAELSRMQTLLSSASVIIMNTPEAAKSLKKTFSALSKKRIVTITNGFDHEDFKEIIVPRKDDKFRIVHSGYLHTDLGLNLLKRKYFHRTFGGKIKKVDILTRSHVVLLKAIERWLQHNPDIRKDLELVFVGKTSKKDRSVAEDSNIPDLIHFKGYKSHHDTVKIIRTADLLFLPMHNVHEKEHPTIVPGKTYEYMASGRPILAAVPDGDAKDFLAKSGTSFICKPDDCDGMVRILDQVYRAWKNKEAITSSNENFIGNFERKKLTKNLATEFDRLLA